MDTNMKEFMGDTVDADIQKIVDLAKKFIAQGKSKAEAIMMALKQTETPDAEMEMEMGSGSEEMPS